MPLTSATFSAKLTLLSPNKAGGKPGESGEHFKRRRGLGERAASGLCVRRFGGHGGERDESGAGDKGRRQGAQRARAHGNGLSLIGAKKGCQNAPTPHPGTRNGCKRKRFSASGRTNSEAPPVELLQALIGCDCRARAMKDAGKAKRCFKLRLVQREIAR